MFITMGQKLHKAYAEFMSFWAEVKQSEAYQYYLGGLRAHYLKYQRYWHILFLISMCFAVYSNNYHHDYPLDSAHAILDNMFIRNLQHIPRYFVDAKTSSTQPDYVGDYRPLTQTTYALNYWMGGYNTVSWHLVQILMHISCVLGLYFLALKLLTRFASQEVAEPATSLIALMAALLYAVHPTGAGVVNYLYARSSLQVAALLFPSLVCYMRAKYHPEGLGNGEQAKQVAYPLLPAFLYWLALFSKVEAIGALPVYFLYDVLETNYQRRKLAGGAETQGGFFKDLFLSFNKASFKRIQPFLILTFVYFLFRLPALSFYETKARYSFGMSELDYLITQFTSWWYYVYTWFAPVKLIADNLAYPIFYTILAPPVLLAIGGWLVVIWIFSASYKRYPYLSFLALSSLSIISPTSSFMVLADMVNEHRAYMARAVFSLCVIIPVGIYLVKAQQNSLLKRALMSLGCAILVFALFALTYDRNRVFANEEAYHTDNLQKAPSMRAYVNFGRILAQKGKFDDALKYYFMAFEQAPYWPILNVNIGIAYQHKGDQDKALEYFTRAVDNERYSSVGLTWRASLYLQRKQYDLALADYQKSLALSTEYLPIYRGLAIAYAGMGDWQKSVAYTLKCYEIDPSGTERAIADISQPYWDNSSLHMAGINYYQEIDKHLPNRWWIQQNIGNLSSKVGDEQSAQQYFMRAQQLKGNG